MSPARPPHQKLISLERLIEKVFEYNKMTDTEDFLPIDEESTLAELRDGREPVWTRLKKDVFIRDKDADGDCVRCTRHLPSDAIANLNNEEDRDPQWFPPQEIYVEGGIRWVDNLVSETWSFDRQGNYILAYRDTRPCGVCAFQQGIDRVRQALYKHKFFQALEENWMRPRPDGTCGYAEWSWNKMKQELESEGAQFN